METMGDRLRWCRRRYDWTQRDLARLTSVGLATIRRIEQHEFEPRLETVRRLAERLNVREGWLAFGDEPMVGLAHMTADEQHRAHAGPGTERLPGYVVVGPGPWHREGDEWQIDTAFIHGQEREA
jgi:transcriptional regulator with XRE-family HTH domain